MCSPARIYKHASVCVCVKGVCQLINISCHMLLFILKLPFMFLIAFFFLFFVFFHFNASPSDCLSIGLFPHRVRTVSAKVQEISLFNFVGLSCLMELLIFFLPLLRSLLLLLLFCFQFCWRVSLNEPVLSESIILYRRAIICYFMYSMLI